MFLRNKFKNDLKQDMQFQSVIFFGFVNIIIFTVIKL
jgi:hypothetical protein